MLNSYEINKETIAIVPINNNNSKVLEEENTININKNSSMIIDDSCRFFGSSYMGRHEGTKSLLGINYKSPIVVEESNEIIFFPTASPRVEDCHWISLKHVDKLEKNGLKTKILFKAPSNSRILELMFVATYCITSGSISRRSNSARFFKMAIFVS